MNSKFSPELIVARYIKSATNGRILTVRMSRLLALIILPIWLVVFILSGIMMYDGIRSFVKLAEIEDHRKISTANIQSSIDQSREISRIDDEYYYDKIQNDNRISVLFLPAFIVICFGIPWALLRLVFWIIDGDNTKVPI